MKLKSVSINDFRRFTKLNVKDIPETSRLIMLAGPNGSGKSSFFDALKSWQKAKSIGYLQWEQDYHKRSETSVPTAFTDGDISVEFYNTTNLDKHRIRKSFHFRTAYRNEPEFRLKSLQHSGDMTEENRFNRMIDNDAAVSKNYQRLVSYAFKRAFDDASPDTTLKSFREETIGTIRDSFNSLFPDITLDSLGDPLSSGTFTFTKGNSSGFLFKNLSGGEKAAFDLLLDLVVARGVFDDTTFCIDEPETHMNMRVQAELLATLFSLVPEHCQLIVATHSVGMMRKARDLEIENPGSVAFLDFGDRNFDLEQVITPISPNRTFWERTYAVALDDLSKLISPSCVIICEGSPKTPKATKNQSHDAQCYNKIFENDIPDAKFISGGSASEVSNDRFVLTEAISHLIEGVSVIRIIDRDDRSIEEIEEEKDQGVRVLSRRNIESYLFDDEVITELAKNVDQPDKATELLRYKRSLIAEKESGAVDDLKPISGKMYNQCKKVLNLTQCGNNAGSFMRSTLAPLIKPHMSIYQGLRSDIFG
jgi:predicted ATPase